jgi:hypothetical protein
MLAATVAITKQTIKPPNMDTTNAETYPIGVIGPLGVNVASVHKPGAVHHHRSKPAAQAKEPAISDTTCRQGGSFRTTSFDSPGGIT